MLTSTVQSTAAPLFPRGLRAAIYIYIYSYIYINTKNKK